MALERSLIGISQTLEPALPCSGARADRAGGAAQAGAPTAASQLSGKRKWVDECAVVAALVWKRTEVKNRWVAALRNGPRRQCDPGDPQGERICGETHRGVGLSDVSKRLKQTRFFCISLRGRNEFRGPLQKMCRWWGWGVFGLVCGVDLD